MREKLKLKLLLIAAKEKQWERTEWGALSLSLSLSPSLPLSYSRSVFLFYHRTKVWLVSKDWNIYLSTCFCSLCQHLKSNVFNLRNKPASHCLFMRLPHEGLKMENSSSKKSIKMVMLRRWTPLHLKCMVHSSVEYKFTLSNTVSMYSSWLLGFYFIFTISSFLYLLTYSCMPALQHGTSCLSNHLKLAQCCHEVRFLSVLLVQVIKAELNQWLLSLLFICVTPGPVWSMMITPTAAGMECSGKTKHSWWYSCCWVYSRAFRNSKIWPTVPLANDCPIKGLN